MTAASAAAISGAAADGGADLPIFDIVREQERGIGGRVAGAFALFPNNGRRRNRASPR